MYLCIYFPVSKDTIKQQNFHEIFVKVATIYIETRHLFLNELYFGVNK